MPPDTIDRDGIEWIEIRQAAKLSRTKATVIGEAIAAGTVRSLDHGGETFIPLTAMKRIKRETALLRSIERGNRIGDTLPGGRRAGPLSAHREKQDVLPMSSGRDGRGWKG